VWCVCGVCVCGVCECGVCECGVCEVCVSVVWGVVGGWVGVCGGGGGEIW